LDAVTVADGFASFNGLNARDPWTVFRLIRHTVSDGMGNVLMLSLMARRRMSAVLANINTPSALLRVNETGL